MVQTSSSRYRRIEVLVYTRPIYIRNFEAMRRELSTSSGSLSWQLPDITFRIPYVRVCTTIIDIFLLGILRTYFIRTLLVEYWYSMHT